MTQEAGLLTPPEAVARLAKAGLHITDQTLRDWAKAGLVPHTRLPSGRYRFRVADIDAIPCNTAPAPTPTPGG